MSHEDATASAVFNPTSPVPSHVPPDLVLEYDPQADPEYPSKGWGVFSKGPELPPIFWSPMNGGGWVVTRANLLQEVFSKAGSFSSRNASMGIFGRRVLPADSDPPEHSRYRGLVNALFTPAAVAQREVNIRELAGELVQGVWSRGRCDFVTEIADVMPTTVFTALVGMPAEDAQKLRGWVEICLGGWLIEGERAKTIDAVIAYLTDLIAQRRAQPGDDLVSHILGADTAQGPLSDDEALDFVYLLFLGGLDSLAGSMAHVFYRLARKPEEQAIVREAMFDQARIAPILEDYFRMHPVLRSVRHLARDLDFHGVEMRAGDAVFAIPGYANYDADRFADPEALSTDKRPSHMTFGMGPHHCLGSHLARLEMRILIQEWFARIPDFRMEPGAAAPTYLPGAVRINSLPLSWERTSS